MINGEQRFQAPRLSRWHGMALIVDETVPPGGYVITDARGIVLSGGNIETGETWLRRNGSPSRIYVTEPVARELIETEDAVYKIKGLH